MSPSDSVAAADRTSYAGALRYSGAYTGRRIDWTSVIAWMVIATVAVLILATFQDYGISWDEMVQNTYGKKLLQYYASGFENKSAFYYSNLYLYGGLFDLAAALANHVSPFGEYETRHLLGGLAFVAGLIGAWKLAGLLAGPRAALLAVVCLATDPSLYGHSFINPKDSPLAWLLIWVMYFGCRILERPHRPKLITLIGFAVSLGLAMGTRIIAVAFIVFFGAALCLNFSTRFLTTTRPGMVFIRFFRTLGPMVAVMPLALLLMAAFWPWSVLKSGNVIQALTTFSHFTWHPLVLWNGAQVPSTNLPAAYLTRLLLFKLPEYVLLGVVLALIAGVAALRSGRAMVLRPRFSQYLYIAMCVILPVLGFVLMRPVVYNGIRHFLFIVPPLVLLAAIGLDRGLAFAFRHGHAVGVAASLCLFAAVSWQTARMAELHPYEYVAYNSLIGGIPGAETRFELDYWGTSLGEASRGLAAYVAKNHIAKPTVYVCGDREFAAYFLPPTISFVDNLEAADFFMSINDPPCRDHFDNPRNPVFAVKREGVTLSYVLDLRHPQAVVK